MQDTETRNIDGATYQSTQLSAWASLKLLHRLASLVGQPLIVLIVKGAKAGSVSGALDSDLDEGSLGLAVANMLAQLDDGVLESVTRQILASTSVKQEGKSVDVLDVFDLHFRGRMFHLMRVIQFALEVNYRDFTGGLRSIGKRDGVGSNPGGTP